MRTCTWFVASLIILSIPCVSLSMQQSPEQIATQSAPSQSEMVVRIFRLQYHPVDEMGIVIESVSQRDEVTITADESTNSLVVRAPRAKMEEIAQLISALDVRTLGTVGAEDLMYRVYMLEVPSKDQNLKPFSLILERPSQLPSTDLLDTFNGPDVQIGAFAQSKEWSRNDEWQIVIQGRAASNDALKQLIAKIPDAQVKELRWDDETFTAGITAAQVSRMPAPLQEYVRKLLGDEVQTVGYWFGGLSAPGDVKASIGLWTLELKAEPAQKADLTLEIRLNQDAPVPFIMPVTILSNSVRGRIGKPIIIGYNRHAYGTRKMGALVILPEAEPTAGPGGPSATPTPETRR
jgi:hypothetical protein